MLHHIRCGIKIVSFYKLIELYICTNVVEKIYLKSVFPKQDNDLARNSIGPLLILDENGKGISHEITCQQVGARTDEVRVPAVESDKVLQADDHRLG